MDKMLTDSSFQGKILFKTALWNWMVLDVKMRIKSAIAIVFFTSSFFIIIANYADFVSTYMKINSQNSTLDSMEHSSIVNANELPIYVQTKSSTGKEFLKSIFYNYSSINFLPDLSKISANLNSFFITELSTDDSINHLNYSFVPNVDQNYNITNLILNHYSNMTDRTIKNWSKGVYHLPARFTPRSLFWGEWVFPASYIFLIISHFYPLSRWMHSKQLVLLNVAGISDSVIWLGFVIFDLIYCVISSLWFSIFEYTHKKFIETKSNFFFIYLFFLLASISFYFSGIFAAPIFNRPGRFGFFIFYYIVAITSGWILPSVLAINPLVNCYIYPSATTHNFYLNAYFTLLANRSLTFKNPGDYIAYPTPQLFGYLLLQISIFSFLLVVFTLLCPKEWGIPPIGFKNMFKPYYWKKLFSRSNDFVENSFKPFISVKNLTKYYKGQVLVKAIDDIDFCIDKGEVILLIGPNGSGKSTLLQSLTGSIPTTSGEIQFYGNPGNFLDLQKRTGYCYQENIFFDNLTIRGHLEFFAKLRGIQKPDLQDEIDKVSSLLELTELLDNYPAKLSAGLKRCVSTAMAFIGSPSLVILDEPTVGVDIKRRHCIWNIANHYKNTTTIIASHSLEESEAIASRLFVIEKGKIKFTGTPSELRRLYNCGYRLKIIVTDDDEAGADEIVNKVLELTKQTIPEAELDFERGDSIMLPVCDKIPNLLTVLDKRIKETGAVSYTISIENLEHVMLRMIANGDEY